MTEYKKAELLFNIMKQKKYEDGISTLEIKKELSSIDDFEKIFNIENHKHKKKQWWDSARRWIGQYSLIDRKDRKNEVLFLPLAKNDKKTGIYTYKGNPKFSNYFDDQINAIEEYDAEVLNTEEKRAIVKI